MSESDSATRWPAILGLLAILYRQHFSASVVYCVLVASLKVWWTEWHSADYLLAANFLATIVATVFLAVRHGSFLFLPCDLSQLAMMPPQGSVFAVGLSVCFVQLFAWHLEKENYVGMFAAGGLLVAANWNTLDHFTPHCVGAAVAFVLYTYMAMLSPHVSWWAKCVLMALFAARSALAAFRLLFGAKPLAFLGLFPDRAQILELYTSPEYEAASRLGSPLQWLLITCLAYNVHTLFRARA